MRSNLKTALAARHMRQVELAAAVGISPSTLSEFIHGWAELAPHLQERIAEVLRTDPTWLFARVTQIPAPKPPETSLAGAA
jgi:transcriptional regulator with XRE-family HTH domain